MNHSARTLLLSMPELLSGICPVCTENWAADPECYCSCTRPRPGDEEAMAAAYRHAAAIRAARLAANQEAQEADMTRRRAVATRHPAASGDPRRVVAQLTGRR